MKTMMTWALALAVGAGLTVGAIGCNQTKTEKTEKTETSTPEGKMTTETKTTTEAPKDAPKTDAK